jgi:cytochrome c2
MLKKYSIFTGLLVLLLLLAACGEPKIHGPEAGHGDDAGHSEEVEHDEAGAEEHSEEPAGDESSGDETGVGNAGSDETPSEDNAGDSEEPAGDAEATSENGTEGDAESANDDPAQESGAESQDVPETSSEEENSDDPAAEEAPETSMMEPTSIGNPGNGEQLFLVHICNSCHMVDQELTLVGPSLQGIASRAGSRVEGLTTVEYIRQSILEPNAYVVDTFPMGVMPQTFATILSDQDVNDLIAYLLTL